MRYARCCPADCNVRSDWEKELREEMDSFNTPEFRKANTILKVLSHPSRLQIVAVGDAGKIKAEVAKFGEVDVK
jgi:hypothetical protein